MYIYIDINVYIYAGVISYMREAHWLVTFSRNWVHKE